MSESPTAAEPATERLQPLDPAQKSVLRVRTLIVVVALLAMSLVVDLGPLRELETPFGLASGIVGLLGLAALLILPARRYRLWGYREDEDELQVRSGMLFRLHTIVPFGRVQHIDIAQGPIERAFGVATLILHTAGTRGSSVPLPGLARGQAEAMRDRIRGKIRQELA